MIGLPGSTKIVHRHLNIPRLDVPNLTSTSTLIYQIKKIPFWLAMPLGAGMSYNIKKDKLAFGIGKCRLQQLTIILLFAVPLTAIILYCPPSYSSKVGQCGGGTDTLSIETEIWTDTHTHTHTHTHTDILAF